MRNEKIRPMYERLNHKDTFLGRGEHGPAIVTKDGWKLRTHLHPDFGYGVFGAYWGQIRDKVTLELYHVCEDTREEENRMERDPRGSLPQSSQKEPLAFSVPCAVKVRQQGKAEACRPFPAGIFTETMRTNTAGTMR